MAANAFELAPARDRGGIRRNAISTARGTRRRDCPFQPFPLRTRALVGVTLGGASGGVGARGMPGNTASVIARTLAQKSLGLLSVDTRFVVWTYCFMKAHAPVSDTRPRCNPRPKGSAVDAVLHRVFRDYHGNLRAYFEEIDRRKKPHVEGTN